MPYHVLIVNDILIIQNDVFASYLYSCLCQQLLKDYTTDDSGDRQTPVNSWMEGVKLDIPARQHLLPSGCIKRLI